MPAAMPAGSPGELAGRLLDRLVSAGTVTVPIESVTRGGIEDVEVNFQEDGVAQVTSGSGRTYIVDYNNEQCNCINHRVRGGRCRHITAVERAIGFVAAGEDPSSSGGTSLNIGRAVDIQNRIDGENETSRSSINNIAEDDGFFYSDNEEEFSATLERARGEGIEYEYRNALNGSDATFRLEIEFVGGDPDAIARDLYQMGICAYDRRVSYHSPSVSGKWKLELDSSVSMGSQGGELISPVLRDNPKTWRQIETVCEVAKRHGARIDYHCGGHVHVGMDSLDTARQRWKRFFRLIRGFEDEIYRMAGGTEGRVRRNYLRYATPFRGRAEEGINRRFRMENQEDVQRLCSEISGRNRYHGINLTNIYEYSKPNTVEFRYFNSSLDPRQLQANVKLANGIIMAAEKARTRSNQTDNASTEENMRKRGNMLKQHSLDGVRSNDHSGIKKLIDIVFTRKKDKDDILKVYVNNDWAN